MCPLMLSSLRPRLLVCWRQCRQCALLDVCRQAKLVLCSEYEKLLVFSFLDIRDKNTNKLCSEREAVVIFS